MITPRLAAVALVTTLLVTPTHAASPYRGRLLYENWCYHCHLSNLHYRVGGRVDSRGKLVQMVAMWQSEMRLGWGAEDIADVASYLDRLYYRFAGIGIE